MAQEGGPEERGINWKKYIRKKEERNMQASHQRDKRQRTVITIKRKPKMQSTKQPVLFLSTRTYAA